MKKAPVGSCWRILVREPNMDLRSGNYQLLDEKADEFERGGVFDELAIVFAPDGTSLEQHNTSTLHLEQMTPRTWYLGIGDLQFNIHVGASGALEVALYGSDKTKFTDGR